MSDASRRTFLRGAGLLGAGVAATSALGATAAPAGASPLSWQPDPDDPRFTVVVMPDTQYLFDADRGDSAPLDASLRYVLGGSEDNIVFLCHLGDLTEHGQPGEIEQIGQSFRALDRQRAAYSVLAGNHDVNSSTDDQRGTTPYLATFGPQRFRTSPTFRGASKDGYNSYHVFRAAGQDWLVLAMDWRPSAAGFAWARDVLGKHPRTPVILTTHELAYADDAGQATVSEFGRRLWDELINDHDQVFLTLNGHYWPPGRTVLRNRAGNEVHVHIANYQDRYYGGSAMIRLYRFDLARNVIDVRTVSPWLLERASDRLNELNRLEIELSGPVNYFTVPIDFTRRFSGFAPKPAPQPRPARELLVPGTVAYWRFDTGRPEGTPLADTDTVRDLTGRGNDLTRVTLPGSDESALVWSGEFHQGQPAHASLRFTGSKNPGRGAYLRTVASAPLNAATFDRGYTIEAFVKLPADFKDGQHAWCGVFSRLGSGADAGKTGDDPKEPAATLAISDGAGFQWAVFPLNQNAISTNWGHELPLDKWWHVALVNDGRHTTMYVDGCPVLRNPKTPAAGIAAPRTGGRWLLGAYDYDRTVDQGFHGWIGDVRVVERPLRVAEFMLR
ncbi:LamG domain-containing protein [Kutzneria viridogrisea]|uniref:3',5'-cyclic AMP phosphodiesterase CpdA n=1 Tax=Kutzneria viridogrisea TaxID=47990 RepID=A0ABR6BLK0_9PSEU|nr:3',5'-cyclic AMP phosphodiesterase CpdA [Kutzneria viridogrisea]